MDAVKAKKGKLYLVSNAHLDTQWNWTVRDTIRECLKATLDDNFALLEKYPAYRMNFEGAFRYRLMKEYYPEKYEKMKGYIAEGRWNVAGSTWGRYGRERPLLGGAHAAGSARQRLF